MKILLTGASGFLGGILKKELFENEIFSLGRNDADIVCNIVDEVPKMPVVDLVIHAAGKAHVVPKDQLQREEFYDVNVRGTKNLLSGINETGVFPQSFVFISTVAVYGLETGSLINENCSLMAQDPYGESKIIAEQLVEDWCGQHGIICTIFRLPLIAGPNPPGNLHTMIDGIQKGYYFNVAGGNARKSIVLAEDVARIIPKAAAIGGIYNLTDGEHPSFFELSAAIATQLSKSTPPNIPKWAAQLLGKMGDVLGKRSPINSSKLNKIMSDLTFDDSKAFQVLGWQPQKVLTAFKIN